MKYGWKPCTEKCLENKKIYCVPGFIEKTYSLRVLFNCANNSTGTPMKT